MVFERKKSNKDIKKQVSNTETSDTKEQAKSPAPGTSSTDLSTNVEKESFGNSFEFLLTCLGLSVGLGNIWRFPTRAFNNGGAAFLIPYLIFSFLFGLPAVYLEMACGQYSQASPPILFHRIMPILEGIGWMGAIVAGTVSVYYIVLISWICIYMVNILRGHTSLWTRCDNPWNNLTSCIDVQMNLNCNETMNTNGLTWINNECVNVTTINYRLQPATEQYFYQYILKPSNGLYDIGSVNWPIFGSTLGCWIVVVLVLWKGMKVMSKVSYVTVLLPYIIIVILFFRGVTLKGAGAGLYYYLGNPDFSKLGSIQTWTEALKQMCFSISIGHGGLMSMASYNKKRNNCFRDALVVIAGDTAMSIVGGAAVFSTMGFLANQRGVEVPEVVTSGLSIAFSVYPEAVSQMPGSPFWAFLFFLMLFLLGLSTEIALVEVFTSCVCSRFPFFKNKKLIVVVAWSLLLFCMGILMTTDAGIYWFEMFDDYAGFSSIVTALMGIAGLVYIYGAYNIMDDIEEMMGPPKNKVTAYIGSLSPYFVYNWRFVTPLIGVVLMVLSMKREYPFQGDAKKYPILFDIGGMFIQMLPLIIVPVFSFIVYRGYKKHNHDLRGMFMIQRTHSSYGRLFLKMSKEEQRKQSVLASNEPWDETAENDLMLSKIEEKSLMPNGLVS